MSLKCESLGCIAHIFDIFLSDVNNYFRFCKLRFRFKGVSNYVKIRQEEQELIHFRFATSGFTEFRFLYTR